MPGVIHLAGGAFGQAAVGQPFDQVQRHVDAGRNAGRRHHWPQSTQRWSAAP
jgi:hypothetical protein